MSTIAERISELIDDYGGAPKLARATGLKASSLYDWAHGTVEAKASSLATLAMVSPKGANWLLLGEDHDDHIQSDHILAPPGGAADGEAGAGALGHLPLLGTAAGSLSGSMILSGETIEWKRRPALLAYVTGAYCLRVVGTSMSNRFLPGDIVFVHPLQTPKRGDIVIIQETRPQGSVAFLKEFIAERPDRIVTRQYAPEATLEHFKRAVLSVHRVLTNNEIFEV
jgi:SOS-response transcriptional repressor LexA